MKTSKGIYKITSLNGSIYIGMTTLTFSERWRQHLKSLKAKSSHMCKGLQRAFDKYGKNGLTFEILEVLDYHSCDEIMQREIHWWNLYKIQGINIYNGKPTGTGSVIHTDETKEKMRKANLILVRKRGHIIWDENIMKCPVCEKNFSGKPNSQIYCSDICSKKNPKMCKIDYISRDNLIEEIQKGGTYLDIPERLGIKKSSFYTLMNKYNLKLNDVRNNIITY